MSPQQHTLLKALRGAGASGVHSHDARTQLGIGDPSRRIADLVEQGYRIQSKLERRNGAHGVRYRLLPGSPIGSGGGVSEIGGPDTQGKHSFPRPGLGSENGGASAGGLNSPPPAAPRSVRYPAQSLRQWSTEPDDREGWMRVREFDGSWWWELTAPEPSQRELAA